MKGSGKLKGKWGGEEEEEYEKESRSARGGIEKRRGKWTAYELISFISISVSSTHDCLIILAEDWSRLRKSDSSRLCVWGERWRGRWEGFKKAAFPSLPPSLAPSRLSFFLWLSAALRTHGGKSVGVGGRKTLTLPTPISECYGQRVKKRKYTKTKIFLTLSNINK